MKVSLDAYDEDSYESVRGVRKFKAVINNIKKYREKHPFVNLGIQTVVTQPDDIYKFYSGVLHENLDVDYISFRPLESPQGEFYSDKYLTEYMLRLTELKPRDKRVLINYKWSHVYDKTDSCVGWWTEIAVDENSNILYCCQRPDEVVCHITDTNIMAKMAAHKIDFSKCDVPCRLTGVNDTLLHIDIGEYKDYCFV